MKACSRLSAAWMARPCTPAWSQRRTTSRCGSTLEMVELARGLPPPSLPLSAAAMAASSASSALASSQPCCKATARSTPSLSRPMRPERATSRRESPARSRTSTCRYWNISILLRLMGAFLSKKARKVAPGNSKASRRLRRWHWPVYADSQVAGICRLRAGRQMPTPPPDQPVLRWPDYADSEVA